MTQFWINIFILLPICKENNLLFHFVQSCFIQSWQFFTRQGYFIVAHYQHTRSTTIHHISMFSISHMTWTSVRTVANTLELLNRNRPQTLNASLNGLMKPSWNIGIKTTSSGSNTLYSTLLSVIIAILPLAWMDQQAPDKSMVYKSLWKCGSSSLLHVNPSVT